MYGEHLLPITEVLGIPEAGIPSSGAWVAAAVQEMSTFLRAWIFFLGLGVLVAVIVGGESEQSKEAREAREEKERQRRAAALMAELEKDACDSNLRFYNSFGQWHITCPDCDFASVPASEFVSEGMLYEIKRHSIDDGITMKELMHVLGNC